MGMQYRVLRAFRAMFGEREYSGLPGQVIEVPEEVAAWLERDSPGRIERAPTLPSPASQGREMEGAPRDRMQRRKRNR
jgi:hypothetical protein